MPAVSDLRAKITIDGADQAEGKLKQIHKVTNDTGNAFTKALGTVTGFLAGFGIAKIATDALGMLKDQIVDVYNAAASQAQVTAQTNAVLESTHGIAGMTKDSIEALATQWAHLTGVSDDDIQSMENVLLTFTSIGKDVFPTATQAIMDMSTSMHQGLQPTAIMVGKALQDPIQGATALRRVGVQLSDSQIELIKHLEETGQHAKAQQVILGELTKEFGGSAEAVGKTFPGQLAILNEKLDETKESIGLAVMPVLQAFVSNAVQPMADALGKILPEAINGALGILKDLQTTLAPLGPVVETIFNNAKALGELFLDSLAPSIDKIRSSFSGSGPDLQPFADTMLTLVRNLTQVADNVIPKVADAINNLVLNFSIFSNNKNVQAVKTYFQDLAPHLQEVWDRAQPVIKAIGENLVGAFKTIAPKIVEVIGALQNFQAAVAERLGPVIDVWGPRLMAIVDSIMGVWNAAWPYMQVVFQGVWNIIVGIAQFFGSQLQGIIEVLLDVLGGKWEKVGPDWNHAMDNAMGGIKNILKGAAQVLAGLVASIVAGMLEHLKQMNPQGFKAMQDAMTHIQQALKDPIGTLRNLGQKLLQAVIDGIKDMAGNLAGVVHDVIHNAFGNITLPGGGHLPGFASGGDPSGFFRGAEDGAELLTRPGVYYAEPGSHVFNADETRAILGGGSGGHTVHQHFAPGSIVIEGTNLSADEIYDAWMARASWLAKGTGNG